MGIVARDLRKHFGSAPAVDGISLEVREGEIYGLIGPNGAGKTTTLRMLAGLIRPDEGRAEICGHDVERQPEQAKAAIGFLTASMGLYARLTARELLTYFGRLYGMSREAIARRLQTATELLRIEHLLDRRCGGLSTGERQRVSLARATLHDPPVLILDEPTAGLDVLASRFVADFIRERRANGRAILFSTHYLTEAELLCDRIGLIHRGRLLREGPPAALKAERNAGSLEEAFLGMIGEERAS